jgi:serine protease AprX
VASTISKDVKVVLSMGDWHKDVSIKKDWVNAFVGQTNAGDIVVDITDVRDWQWFELDDLALTLDHHDLDIGQTINYDTIGLQVTTVPGETVDKVKFPKPKPAEALDASQLVSTYNQTIRSDEVWNKVWNEGSAYLQGQGITVAVVDSGVGKSKDLGDRKFQDVNFNREYHDGKDKYGHGTFVASVVAGNGDHSKGEFIGVAPAANVLNVRVANDHGMSTEADVIEALTWVLTNKDVYKIRVVNLSLNSSVSTSYLDSPLCAMVEWLWLNGIVVVVSAGNSGTQPNKVYPPANDPFVITVGASDDQGSLSISDDVVADFSASSDIDGVTKPDLVAPGVGVVMYLPSNNKLIMGQEHSGNRVNDDYFRMSGTSISAPMVSGAVALLLQSDPNLAPDQVKYLLTSRANTGIANYSQATAGAGILDIYAAIEAGTPGTLPEKTYEPNNFVKQLILTAIVPAVLSLEVNWNSVDWTSAGLDGLEWSQVNWNSVNWNSVNWNSVNWNSVNWNSVNWNSVNWNSVNWNSVNWNSVNWNSVNWNSVNWNSVNWNSVNWNSVNWNSVNWNSVNWNSVNWNSVNWNSVNWNSDYWGD